MRFMDFFQSLLPRLKKDEVMEDLRVTESELVNAVMPVYEDGAKFFAKEKFKSEAAKDLSMVFYRNYSLAKAGKAATLVNEIESRLKNVRSNIQLIVEANEALLEADMIKDGLTAKKTILIRCSEQLSFVTRYAIDLLNYIYVVETRELGKGDPDSTHLVPAIEQRLVANVANFARLLSIFGDETSELKKKFDDMPDVVVNTKTYHALSAVYSDSKLDPFTTLMVQGFEGNPIYHIRMMFAEWQANRYKCYKDKKKMLELRLLNLKVMQEKDGDPKLDREIQYVQGRIESYEYKMAKMEESVH